MSGIGGWIDRTASKAGEAIEGAADRAGEAIVSGAETVRDDVAGAASDVRAWYEKLSTEAKRTLDDVSLPEDRAVTPDMDAPTRAATAKANQLKDLVRMPGAAAQALRGRLPGGTTITSQVLDILKTCKTSAELDSVLSQVGRRPLLSRLNILEGPSHGGDVKAAIDAVRQSDVRPGDWTGFDRYLDQVTGTRARPGNDVTLLNGLDQAFPEMYKTIDAAKDTIDVESYNFSDDTTGREYASHLIAAAKRGVTVNVMMDGHGSKGNDALVAELRANGVNVNVGKTDLIGAQVDHRKVLVVDGKTGFTGGMNITDHDPGWRDMHSKVEGPAVQDLEKAFAARWKDETGGPLPGKTVGAPPVAPKGGESVRVVPHTGDQDENIRLAYMRAIDTATTSITIADPYFTDSEVMDHLTRAAARGVAVKVVWPAQNDEPTARAVARAHYQQLIDAGIQVYEYQPAMAHQKVAVIDGKFATIGSSNLDARSLRADHELNVMTVDPVFAGKLEGAIDGDIAQSTRMTDENRASWDQPLAPALRVATLEDEV
jgi:cardiolipin synthase